MSVEPHRSAWLGLDIGGANLKYASASGDSFARYFPMWSRSHELADQLASDIDQSFPDACHWGVTMTGELADCFADRQQGVLHIINEVMSAAGRLGVEDVIFYGVDGQFRSAESACRRVDLIAAANWHALASYVAACWVQTGRAVLVDIGSTTTDIIPLRDGAVDTRARTDFDRLREGSLVYVGCRRTPVCSLVDQVVIGGECIEIMNEWFATIDDVRLVLGFETIDPDDCETADGRPRTVDCAVNRIARMIGRDRRSFSRSDAAELAGQVHTAAARRIFRQLERHIEPPTRVILSGHGDDLLDRSAVVNSIRLAEELGENGSRAAPALAVARLMMTRQRGGLPATCSE